MICKVLVRKSLSDMPLKIINVRTIFKSGFYKNSSRKPLWTSQTIEAEGGMDPDLYGRPQFADLNWKLQKFEIPSDLNPDYFSVAFLNDHCCGLSGGDRNFFVDWLAFTG